jgi:fused signal recognition particle receptor
MFKFLKNKIKDAVEKFTSSAEEDSVVVDENELSPEEKERLVVEEKSLSAQDLLDMDVDSDSSSDFSSDDGSSNKASLGDGSSTKASLKDDDSVDSVGGSGVSDSLADDEGLVSDKKGLVSDKGEVVSDEDDVDDESQLDVDALDEELSSEFIHDVIDDSDPVVEVEAEKITDTDDLLLSEARDETISATSSSGSDGVSDSTSKDSGLVGSDDGLIVSKESPVEEQTTVDNVKKGSFFKRIFKKSSSEEVSEKESEESPINKSELSAESPSVSQKKESSQVVVDDGSSSDVSSSKNTVLSEKHKEYSSAIDSETIKDTTKKKKGFFGKIKEKVVKFKLDEEKCEELFWEFELAMMENNVAMEVIEKIKADLHDKLTQENVSRRSIDEVILSTLKESLEEVFDVPQRDLLQEITAKNVEGEPFVVCVVGVNGSGKTTTIGKLIKLLQDNKKSVVVSASDTFRAAAIQQLEEHTNRLGVKLIKHDYNADPSAVAFDAIKHAKAKNIDVVLIDTAGRLQSNSNLMDELKKLVRVNKPHFNLFIGESITGNDCVEQAVAFNDAVGIDGIILSKADIDDKGGAAISVSFVTKKPILYLGVGQTYDDLKPFDKDEILDSLGL